MPPYPAAPGQRAPRRSSSPGAAQQSVAANACKSPLRFRDSDVQDNCLGDGARSPSLDVGFSEDRFLKGVLQEAARGSSGSPAVKRLEGLGFDAEVARVALHVSGGNEQRALEICMSGLAFVSAGTGAGAGVDGSAPTSELVQRAPPAPLHCFICGGSHLTQKSLAIHVKACRRRFEQREAKRPSSQRRQLLEACELPPGVECLERYYELAGGYPGGGRERAAAAAHGGAGGVTPFEDWIALRKPLPEAASLLPCEFCRRTFAPDRLETHQRVCLQRPKTEALPPQQARRRSGSATPPPAAVNAYKSFCDRLARCPGCSRQFRPELLPAHMRQCQAEAQGLEGPPRAAGRSPGARTPPAAAGRGSPQGGARGRHSPNALAATARSGGSPTAQAAAAQAATARGAVAKAGAGVGNPLRWPGTRGDRPKGASAATAAAAATAPTSAPSGRPAQSGAASPAVDAKLLSSEALLARGHLAPAAEEELAKLREQLLARLPSAEFVGAFRVAVGRHNTMYDALRVSLQEEHGGETPTELELWHGTAWESVPKIIQQGFNRSFAGRHGTLLGVATYFSRDPAYSQRFCDRAGGGQSRTKVLFLARVLVGRYCKGKSSDVEPPVMDGETQERFDSTVDNEERPGIFAVFRDFQAVPLFLVEFRS